MSSNTGHIPDKVGFELDMTIFDKPTLFMHICEPLKFNCQFKNICIRSTFKKLKNDIIVDYSSKDEDCKYFVENESIKYKPIIKEKNGVKKK